MLNDLRAALVPGLLSGLLIVVMSVSLAALIFSGDLSRFITEGIALAINTAVITGLGMTLFSRCVPVVSMLDEDTAPLFALLAAFAVASMPPSASTADLYAAVLSVIVIATIVSGLGLVLLGAFRFGGFLQFLPHSVLGGYFSAVGWLLIVGGVGVTVDANPGGPGDALALAEPGQLVRWLPALAVAAWLVALRRRVSRVWLLPVTVVAAIVAFYAVLAILSITPQQALQDQWLLGPFPGRSAGLLNPVAGLELQDVDWKTVIGHGGTMASVLLIAVLSLMLSVGGLGFRTRTEPEMNQELRVAGYVNLASGLGGGALGLPSYSLSSLALDMGAPRSRWVGVVSAAVAALAFLYAFELIAYMPRFVLGGILVYLGMNFLREWLFEGWRKFSPLEYLVIPVILAVSIAAGFLQGIVVGLITAIILFVVKYSQTRVVRYAATGGQIMSNVDRHASAQDVLRQQGERLMVLALQGYLFFGTAGQVYRRLQERLHEERRARLDYLIIDFSEVTGLDASAAQNFQKVLWLAESHGFRLILSGLAPGLGERLRTGGFGAGAGAAPVEMPDLDRSLEWCENRILSGHAAVSEYTSCFEQLAEYLSPGEIERLKSYLQPREVEAGSVLAREGEESHELFFLETCSASAFIADAEGTAHRVRRSTRGTVFGELAFYLAVPRTATVVTDDAGLVFVLSRSALADMQKQAPEVAAGLHRYMAMLLSERLMFTTRTLGAMLR